ncbi:hypothetical protein FB45DRAFT_900727 [Roridomyces roridus]|uniref:P-type Na(+) transporter n=1 Tax=Roridomyces roridus TaxID=1738132 RepID=A0AAD7FT31_9AGAR|nr:hypothetical protein FB45DRAFT_900727 [Roridomyces roridus]
MTEPSTSPNHVSPNVDQKPVDQPAPSEGDEPPIPNLQSSDPGQITRSSTSSTRTNVSEQGIATRSHTLSIPHLLELLDTSPTEGLAKKVASERVVRYGENALGADEGISIIRLLISQLANALTLVLVGALGLSFDVRDWIEGGVIAGVIFVNTVIGFFQEYRAERTMDSLRQLSSPTAIVMRDGQPTVVPAKQVVPGDVVQIKAGDVVPADIRLFIVSNLEVSEQLLTGESVPVVKSIETYKQADLPLGDRLNICYSSTVVTQGRGSGIVVATGMSSQIGRIADAMNDNKDDNSRLSLFSHIKETILVYSGVRKGTPLQRKLTKLAYVLFFCAFLLALVVFAVAKFKITEEVMIYAIAVAVGIVPESLIVVLTLTMSLGTRRMAQRNVIVRKLDALENLGGVTDICSDKTGTLTLGKMSVRKMWLVGDAEGYELSTHTTSDALEPVGDIHEGGDNGPVVNPDSIHEGLAQAIRVASLCNVATIQQNDTGVWVSTGDPTEVALQVFAMKLQMGRSEQREKQVPVNIEDDDNGGLRFQLLREFPFSSDTKKMSTIYFDHENHGQSICYTKGAVERLLNASSSYIPAPISAPNATAPITDELRQSLLAKAEEFAALGLRVIGLAQRILPVDVSAMSRDEVEQDLTFLGLAGIFDPPRPETLPAVRAAKEAGIVVHMLTGDHLSTAKAIAESVEVIGKDAPASAVMTATQFDKMTDDEIDALDELPLVIALCAPQTKVRMIKAGKRRGRHMAMTGDGVNDSPALKLAPIGIAMGLAGSDVAKDASDLVLTDDKFDSIISAVAEGRRLFLNIQRFSLHLLSTNVALVVLLVAGLGLRDHEASSVFPLSPLAVLWVNMITGTPPSLGLGTEKAPKNLMKKPPHSVIDGVFTWALIIDTFAYGVCIGLTCLLSFIIVMYAGVTPGDLATQRNAGVSQQCTLVARARSTVFATLIFEFMLYAWVLKDFERSIFNLEPGVAFYKTLYENKVLWWSVIIACASSVLPIYVPVLNTKVFYQQAIEWEWGVIVGMTLAFILWCDIWKIVRKPLYAKFLPPPTMELSASQSSSEASSIV